MGQVGRRRFLISAGALFVAARGRAQRIRALPTLGFLFPNPRPKPEARKRDPVRTRLRELGWVPDENIVFEIASADGKEDRLPALATELVAKRPDVIWVAGPEAAVAAARATQTIPIVFYGVGYPIEQGLVESLARPGRNITGLASLSEEEWLKRLELLREIAPNRDRLAWIAVETVMTAVSGERVRIRSESIQSAAERLGFEMQRFPVSRREDFNGTFASIRKADVQALLCDFTALTYRERKRIVDFANGHRLPSSFGARPFVEAGGLLSYGASRIGMIVDSFNHVDRILRGANPAELPVELPSKFDLAVNAKTAAALGLTIPPAILLRANRVIE